VLLAKRLLSWAGGVRTSIRKRRVAPLACLIAALALAGPGALPSPAPAAAARRGHAVPRPPAAATSYYMRTVNPHHLYRMGCRLGARVVHGSEPHDALVVLAFGSPRHRGLRFGTSLFGGRFASTSRIGTAGVRYARGFHHCTRKRPGATLRIALGTSNYGRFVGYHHGRAWAFMVNRANRRLEALGYSDRIDVTAADDIEPDWSGPRAARAWVRGYDSANQWPYYDFGGAAGCPPYGNCAGSWTLEDVWYVSWGAAPAIPLPEIYTKSGSSAKQWYRVSLYSAVRHGASMTIAGVVSQHRACHQTPDPCRGMNNTSPRAWKQLSKYLNSDRRTAQHIRWATDMSWAK